MNKNFAGKLVERYWAISSIGLLYLLLAGYLVIQHEFIGGWGDPIDYMEGARNLAAYDSAFHPPLYSATVAVVLAVIGDVFLASKLVAMLAGLAVVLLTWAIGRICFDSDRVGLLAALLLLLTPMFVRYTYVVGSDMLGTALFLGSIYALARASRGSVRMLLLAALLAGLANITRAVYLVLLPAGLLFILFVLPAKVKRKLALSAGYLGVFLLAASPWMVVCLLRHGDLHNWNHVNIAFAIFDQSNSWLYFDEYVKRYPTLLSLITQHPVAVAKHLAGNIVDFPIVILVKQGYLAGALALIGGLSILRRPTLERMAVIISAGMLLTATLLAWFHLRFFLPIAPLIMLFAAYLVVGRLGSTLAEFWPGEASLSRLFERIPLRQVVAVSVLVVAVVASFFRIPSDFGRANVPDEYMVGQFLKSNTPERMPILTSSRNLAWYADRPYRDMRDLGTVLPSQLDSAVRATDAGIFVFTKRHSIYTHPQLEFLLSPEDSLVPASFRLFYRTEDRWPVVAYWIERDSLLASDAK